MNTSKTVLEINKKIFRKMCKICHPDKTQYNETLKIIFNDIFKNVNLVNKEIENNFRDLSLWIKTINEILNCDIPEEKKQQLCKILTFIEKKIEIKDCKKKKRNFGKLKNINKIGKQTYKTVIYPPDSLYVEKISYANINLKKKNSNKILRYLRTDSMSYYLISYYPGINSNYISDTSHSSILTFFNSETFDKRSIQKHEALFLLSPFGYALNASNYYRCSGKFYLYDVITGEIINMYDYSDATITAALAINKNYFAFGTTSMYGKSLIRVCDIKNNNFREFQKIHTAGINSLILLNTDIIVSASTDKTIILWDYNSGNPLKIFNDHKDKINKIAKLNEGLIVSASDDKKIKIWNINRNSPDCTLSGHTGKVNTLVITPDKNIISGDSEGNIIVWDTFAKKSIYSIKAHNNEIYSIIFDKKENSISSECYFDKSEDGFIKFWDYKTGNLQSSKKLNLFTDCSILLPERENDSKGLSANYYNLSDYAFYPPFEINEKKLQYKNKPLNFSPKGLTLKNESNDAKTKFKRTII